MSDLVDNVTRGVLAEFIVASALGIPVKDRTRDSWAAWDLTTEDDIRIEVKSAAYLQRWRQDALSKILFSTRPTRAWNPFTNKQDIKSKWQSHVFVFALLSHVDQRTLNPLDLEQWSFYVVPTSKLAKRERSQHSITLGSINNELGETAIGFGEVAEKVREAARQDRP